MLSSGGHGRGEPRRCSAREQSRAEGEAQERQALSVASALSSVAVWRERDGRPRCRLCGGVRRR